MIPDLQQAFNYNATRFEDFRIACYDASRGGYFRPHRDNTTEGTAHRRFAMSLLLNDDYEGGHLRFPEHSVHQYRPKAGSAVVFSCSLLHEATDVTAGRRFVLLSFFYGEAEARRREEYSRATAAGIGHKGQFVLKIPLCRAYQDEAMALRVMDVIKSGVFTLGRECQILEGELAHKLGVDDVVLTSSWSTAVQLLYLAEGIAEGDEILVSAPAPFSSLAPMIHAGARPVFCDVNEQGGLDPADARKRVGNRTVGIFPIHLYGQPVDMDAVMALAKERDLWVLEDCEEAPAAHWNGKPVGQIGDYAVLGFASPRSMTVYGDGGAIATRHADIARRVRILRDHGHTQPGSSNGIGFSLRFNEIQATLGRAQLQVLDGLIAARRRVANWYRRMLLDAKGVRIAPVDVIRGDSVYTSMVIELPDETKRDDVQAALKNKGIESAAPFPIANHQHPAIVDRFGPQPALPRAEAHVQRALSLPIYPAMTQRDVRHVTDVVHSACA